MIVFETIQILFWKIIHSFSNIHEDTREGLIPSNRDRVIGWSSNSFEITEDGQQGDYISIHRKFQCLDCKRISHRVSGFSSNDIFSVCFSLISLNKEMK